MCVTYILTSSLKIYVCNIYLKDIRSNNTSVGNIYMCNVYIIYEQNNELMIFWNFGVKKIDVINFFFKISFIILIIQIALTSIIVPSSQNLARSFIKNSNISDFSNFIKPQKFNDTIKGVTIYTDGKENKNKLNNIYIKKEISSNEFQVTYAKKGIISEVKNNPTLVLFDGATITSRNNKITNISFSPI